MSNTTEPIYSIGEKILCYHGALIYEAKCLDVKKVNSREYNYQVHYNGWSKNWDEWVSPKRILKFTPENVKKQKELIVLSRYNNSNSQVPSNGPPTANPVASNGNKKLRMPIKEAESKPPAVKIIKTEPEVIAQSEAKVEEISVEMTEPIISQTITLPLKILMSKQLKNWLLDDFDFINNQNKLHKLPSRKPVSTLLHDFVASKLNKDKEYLAKLNDTVKGLICYFNVALGSQLLYKFERIQYEENLKSKKNAVVADIYGPIHLLRLIEKLKDNQLCLQLSQDRVESIVDFMNDLLEYMSEKVDELLNTDDYVLAPPYYVRGSI